MDEEPPTQQEMIALKSFCMAEQALKEYNTESAKMTKKLVKQRTASMGTLLKHMIESKQECLALVDELSSLGKFARLGQTHSTRELTPSLIRTSLHDHYEELVRAAVEVNEDEESEESEEEGRDAEAGAGRRKKKRKVEPKKPLTVSERLCAAVLKTVRMCRTTTNPIVQFSNSKPRTLSLDDIPSVKSLPQIVKAVQRVHQVRLAYAQATEVARQQRQTLEEQRAEHSATVASYMARTQRSSQAVIISDDGETAYVRRKLVARDVPPNVTQFKMAVSSAVATMLRPLAGKAVDADGVAQYLQDHKDEFVEQVIKELDTLRTTQTEEIIRFEKARGRRGASE
jgi:hypothetical protein